MILLIVGNIFFKTTIVTIITKLSKEERKKERKKERRRKLSRVDADATLHVCFQFFLERFCIMIDMILIILITMLIIILTIILILIITVMIIKIASPQVCFGDFFPAAIFVSLVGSPSLASSIKCHLHICF